VINYLKKINKYEGFQKLAVNYSEGAADFITKAHQQEPYQKSNALGVPSTIF
jgi:hypothetical protein